MEEINITSENFEKEVLQCSGLVVVDFYATWCMPCKMLAPIVEKVCDEHSIKLCKVDVDDNEELNKKYTIMSVPTLKIFKDGKELNTSIGVITEAKLLELLEIK